MNVGNERVFEWLKLTVHMGRSWRALDLGGESRVSSSVVAAPEPRLL